MADSIPQTKLCRGCGCEKPRDAFPIERKRSDGLSYRCRDCWRADRIKKRGDQPRKSMAGSNNPFWKGGRTVDPRGYVLIKQPDHPRSDVRGYVYEHILVAERTLGRPILASERVHHNDENKSNNDPSNLIVTANDAEHFVHHRKRTDKRMPGEPNPLIGCECGCGTKLPKYDATHRPRRFVSGHNMRKAS